MLIGIGTDIIEIDRIKKACEKYGFKEKIFTESEINYAGENMAALAGNFAVKEAVSKVFGTGFRTFRPKDIEVLRDELGKPYVVLYNKALEIKEKHNVINIQVSISNSDKYAVAFAVGES